MDPKIDTGRERQWVQFRQTSIGPSDRHLKKRNVGHQFRKTPIEPADRHWQKRDSGFSSDRYQSAPQTDT